jgi:hypothetical protein
MICKPRERGMNVREALDQRVLMANLAALVDGMLLGRLDLLGSGVVLACDLGTPSVSHELLLLLLLLLLQGDDPGRAWRGGLRLQYRKAW